MLVPPRQCPACRLTRAHENVLHLRCSLPQTEYIRRDIEGADTDTRRRVAAGLLQTLVKVFPKPITALCNATCAKLLKEYATNPGQNWKQKDTAISIFIASAVKAQTRARGALRSSGVGPRTCSAQLV